MGSPAIIVQEIALPQTRLCYASCGQGPALIIVPATISRIRDWQPLIQFMGQKFTCLFFELPGHGGSTPYPRHFSSELVGKTVEDLCDALQFESITLMGFSFGGILTLRILNQIKARVNRLILLSPCISKRTLLYSPFRLSLLRTMLRLVLRQSIQSFFLQAMHSRVLVDAVLLMLKNWGNVEFYGNALRNTLLTLPASTLEVLTYQVNEILNEDPISEVQTGNIPCILGMSRLDPLLDFEMTKALLQKKFSDIWVESNDHPYHQPPEPLTFDGLNKDFGSLLEKFSR